MSNINFSGVSTGIDWNSVIQAEIQAKTAQTITPLQNSETPYQNEISAYNSLSTLLTTLQSSVQAMDTAADLGSYTVTSSDDSDVSASVSSTASPSSHSVVINQLASAAVETHGGLDDDSTVVNNSGGNLVFAYSYGTKSTSVLVSNGTTLDQLAQLINNDPNNPGVTASVLDDGSGSSTSHHLVLTGNTTGAANTISVNTAATTLAGEWANLTADASAGSSSVTVDNTASLHQYQAVMLGDDDSSTEYNVIDSISGNTLNLRDALGGDLSTDQNAYVTAQGTGSGLSTAATAGSNQITVADASDFEVGKKVIVADANGSEELTISGIDTATNTLTFSSNLANNYAADGYVTQEEGGRKFTFAAGDFTQVQAAANAQFSVDGYPPTGWLQRSSNVVSDAIPGVTLTLSGTSGGLPVNITVSPDVNDVETKINQFVSSYNAVMSFLDTNTAYDSQSNTAGPLLGNYVATLVSSQLQNIIINPAPGFVSGTDAYTQLGQVGINTVADDSDDSTLGTLTVDDSALTDALNTNYDAVIKLFTSDFDGSSSNQNVSFYQASPMLTTPGQYDVQAEFDSAGNLIGGSIKAAGDTTYRAATVDPPYIYGQSGNPESGLWVKAQWDGSSTTENATINVSEGVAGELSDALNQMLDPTDGLLYNATQGDQNIINDTNDQISAAQDRLNDLSSQLTTQYAQLEATLAGLQGQQQALTSMASSLSSSG